MVENINLSINLIKKRIERIKQILEDKKENRITEIYYYESLKINLVEIGDESKKINDFLLEKEGDWDEIISKEYNLRISLTHYYANIHDKIIDKHLINDFPQFVSKINELGKKYLEGKN